MTDLGGEIMFWLIIGIVVLALAAAWYGSGPDDKE